MDLELSVDLDVQVDKARNIGVEIKMMNNLHLNSFMKVYNNELLIPSTKELDISNSNSLRQPTFPLSYAR